MVLFISAWWTNLPLVVKTAKTKNIDTELINPSSFAILVILFNKAHRFGKHVLLSAHDTSRDTLSYHVSYLVPHQSFRDFTMNSETWTAKFESYRPEDKTRRSLFIWIQIYAIIWRIKVTDWAARKNNRMDPYTQVWIVFVRLNLFNNRHQGAFFVIISHRSFTPLPLVFGLVKLYMSQLEQNRTFGYPECKLVAIASINSHLTANYFSEKKLSLVFSYCRIAFWWNRINTSVTPNCAVPNCAVQR